MVSEIATVSLLFNQLSKRKKQTLHSLCAGFVFFLALYIYTRFFTVGLCLFYRVFGIPCFGCGLSRAFVCIMHFDFAGAVEHHVLALPLFVGMFIYFVICVFDLMLNTDLIQRVDRFLGRKYMFVLYAIIVLLAYWYNDCK